MVTEACSSNSIQSDVTADQPDWLIEKGESTDGWNGRVRDRLGVHIHIADAEAAFSALHQSPPTILPTFSRPISFVPSCVEWMHSKAAQLSCKAIS